MGNRGMKVVESHGDLGKHGIICSCSERKNAWVMNVAAEDGPNTLKIIYDRGLIVTIHNWCEASSTCCYLS